MNLTKITYNLPILENHGSLNRKVQNLVFDSREVQPGDLFIAIVGSITNGHKYIEKAIEKGATTIVCQEFPENISPEITYIKVKDTSISLGIMAGNFYDNPSQQLKLVGITGTNGKTTTASLLYNLGENLGYACALISTITIKIHKTSIDTDKTTPNVIKINQILSEAVKAGCQFAFMEVSSHGIEQHRISGLTFTGAAFTNITRDHLDYHKTFKNYLEVKKKFFDDLSPNAFALTNLDDKNGIVMLQNTSAKKLSYALKTNADFKGKILENQLSGMLLQFNEKEFWTPLVGRFNAYNLLLVFGVAQSLGWKEEETLIALSNLENVKGRFQLFKTPTGINIIVDFAHTPDALDNAINTLQHIRSRNEQLLVVFGCGGNRDKGKRPIMTNIATEKADLAILTSDNPRNENPENILNEMEAGVEPHNFKKYLKITNRREAIKTAIKLAEKDDIILIAGKGHETYQEINGVKQHFNDLEEAVNIAKTYNK